MKKCHICDKMDVMEDQEEAGNVSKWHKSANSKYVNEDGSYEDTEATTHDRNGKENETAEVK
jgi:hypothetical protein